MADLCSAIKAMPEFGVCSEHIAKGSLPIHITGMTGSQKSHFIYSLCKASGKKCFVITYDEQEA